MIPIPRLKIAESNQRYGEQVKKIGNELLEQQEKAYKKEVCEILEDYFYPIQVDEELIPFINFDEGAPQKWLLSPKVITKFEHLLRKQEFFLIFYNLFFLNIHSFGHNLSDYCGDSDDRMNFFDGLEFEKQSTLSYPIWKFHHKILLFLIFFPIGIPWIFVRNILIAAMYRIFSWLVVYITLIGVLIFNSFAIFFDQKKIEFCRNSFVGVIGLSLLLPLYSIAFILYAFLWTIVEIISWIFAICFSFNLKPLHDGLIKVREVGDVRMMIKARIFARNAEKEKVKNSELQIVIPDVVAS